MIRLIASDMDHTLLTEAGQLPPDFDNVLARLEAAGIEFAAASGRPRYTLENVFPKHHNRMTLICDNGAQIVHHGKLLAKTLLPLTIIQQMVAKIQALQLIPVICGLDAAVVATADRQYDAIIREFYHEIEYVDDLSTWEGEANKVTLYLPEANAQAIFAQHLNPAYGSDYSVAVSGPVWIDIMPKGVNKGTALHQVSSLLNIPVADMMAFGDQFNDLEMLQTVGHGYAMANAVPEIKAAAPFEAPSNEDFGVVKVIEQLLQKQAHHD